MERDWQGALAPRGRQRPTSESERKYTEAAGTEINGPRDGSPNLLATSVCATPHHAR